MSHHVAGRRLQLRVWRSCGKSPFIEDLEGIQLMSGLKMAGTASWIRVVSAPNTMGM